MRLPKSAFKRSLRIAGVAFGVWKEEISRFAGAQKENVARLKQVKLLVDELGKLKGAAMKFGQILALESRDFFPPEIVAIFEKLQNQATFLEPSIVKKILAQELGERADTLKDLSPQPIAAASIGQVHRARFQETAVAVKIQYPGVGDTVDSDVKILKNIVGLVSPWMGKSGTDYSGLFAEIQEVFRAEVDYRNEAKLTETYRELARSIPGVRVPKVFQEVSTERVLVLSFESGETLTECLSDPRLDQKLRYHFAELFLKVFTAEFCEWGFVQTDPNLGNFLFDLETSELVLLDFGAVRTYSKDFRTQYSRLVLAAIAMQREVCLKLAVELDLIDVRESDEAKDTLFSLLVQSMQPFREEKFDFKNNTYAAKMRSLSLKLIKELQFSPPPRRLIFLHRKLGGMFQILCRLEAEIDLRPYLKVYERCAGP